MHDKNKDIKSSTELRKDLLNGYFFDSIAKSQRGTSRTFFSLYTGVSLPICS